jgi:hypothetical protein
VLVSSERSLQQTFGSHCSLVQPAAVPDVVFLLITTMSQAGSHL